MNLSARLRDIAESVARIETNQAHQLATLNSLRNAMSDLQTLVASIKAKVESENTVIASAEALISQLNTAYQTALGNAVDTGDLTDLQNLADEIDAKQAELAAAVSANTPAPAAGTTPGVAGTVAATNVPPATPPQEAPASFTTVQSPPPGNHPIPADSTAGPTTVTTAPATPPGSVAPAAVVAPVPGSPTVPATPPPPPAAVDPVVPVTTPLEDVEDDEDDVVLPKT